MNCSTDLAVAGPVAVVVAVVLLRCTVVASSWRRVAVVTMATNNGTGKMIVLRTMLGLRFVDC